LYWYTTKDSLDGYFRQGKEWLKDSMTEADFRKVLTYVTAKIDCGHTSVRSSKKQARYIDTSRNFRIFPLSMKLWEDTIAVAANLNRRDSILTRATVIKSINGRTDRQLVDTLFDYISTDGYNRTHKFQSLSNRGYFGTLYTTLFGLSRYYDIGYLDSTGAEKMVRVPVYAPGLDTFTRRLMRPSIAVPQPSRKERKQIELGNARLLQIDSLNHTAMMNLSSFGKGYGLKKFFRQSFKALRKNNIGHLIIDVRSNGGGNVTNSTFISRFISDHRFKVGDSLYAVRKNGGYGKYIENDFWNRMFITFFTAKKKDGHYHFGYFERHYFKPKKKNHFNGKTYILTGGNSFSATTLFAGAVAKQDNVIIVGEETGGGAYGNSAWLIPDVTLPETGLRFRLPLFRLVIDKNSPKTGRGVQPEVEAFPSTEAIKRNADYKLEKAMQLIKEDKEKPLNR
jgi:C-terminal processing protease CtpA/Prc